MNAPILVTGGAGFLGSWLVRRLLERGEAVRVLDLPNAAWHALPLDRIEVHRGDIRDAAAVARAVRGCGAVCHFAGLPQLWAKPRNRFHEVNYQGAVQVLDEAVRAGCARILHVSSATVWPLPGALQCRTADAIGPYCRAKLHAERHALKLARQGAPIVVVSPTLPLGPGDLSRTPPTQLLLDFCRGWRREYLDINLNVIDARDAADAIVRALQAGTPRERYLLGHTTLPLLELYHRLAALTGLAVPRWRVPYSVALTAGIIGEWWSEVVSGVAPVACVAGVRLACRPLPADPAADLRRLGIVPRPLEQTLSETVRWFREVGWLA